MYWIILLLTLLVCLHIYQRLFTRRERSMLAHLPTWPVLPFIGNAYKFFRDRNNMYSHYVDVSNIIEETNKPFVIWVGCHSVVVLSDPEEVRTVSSTNLDKPYIYDFAHSLFGNGLITAPGSVWKHNIKKLGSAFKISNIDAFQDIFNEQSQKLVKNLVKEVNGGPFEIQHKYLTNVTLKAVVESALGVSLKGDMINDMFTDAFLRSLCLLVDRIMNIYLHNEFVYNVTPAYRESVKCTSIVQNLTVTVLRQIIQKMKNKTTEDKFVEDFGKPRVKSFIEILLETREHDADLTEEQIKYEVTTILLAGQETAATTLNFILLILGTRPDVQNKLYDEIRRIFGDSKRAVSKEDLASLTYCEAVIFETMRLYPPVPGILRHVDHDVQLRSCTIPKGATCAFNIWGSGRSKRVWGADALEYRPERWLDPLTASKHASTLLNFGIGKRVCIGKRYALNILKTMLVHCLKEYEFISEADKMTLQMDVLLRPRTANLLQIRPRNRSYISIL